MPLRQGLYWVVKAKSEVRHIQVYRGMPFVLCTIADMGKDARQVPVGVEEKVEQMPLCSKCEREAARVAQALEDRSGVA